MNNENGVNKINMKLVLLAMLLSLFLIYLFMVDFSKQVDHQTREITTDHLADINGQSAKAIEKEFSRVLKETALTVEYISETPELTDAAKKRLYQQLEEKCGFARIRLVSPDGDVYSTEYTPVPNAEGSYIKEIVDGKSGITDVFISGVTGDEVLAFYASDVQDGQSKGGIAGIMVVEQMIDTVISTGFNERSYTYILKPDGAVIMQTNHPDSLYNGRDYLDFLKNNTIPLGISVKRLQEDMEQGKSGIFMFRMGDEKRLAYYSPVGISNWYVMTAVSHDISNLYREQLNVTAFYLTFKIIVLFSVLCLFIIIGFTKTQKIILDSKSDLELEKKKLELSLRHASNTTFEYIPKKDSLTFITPPKIRRATFPTTLPSVSTYAAAYGLIAGEQLEELQTFFSQAAQGADTPPLELAGGDAFKEDTWFRISVSPVRNSKGEMIEAIGTMEDITEERYIKKCFAQEEQYRAALLYQSVIVCSVDLKKQQLIAFSLNGIDQMGGQETLPYDDKFIQKICLCIHPNNHEQIFRTIQTNNMLAAFYTGKRELKELFLAAYPNEGEYRWMSCTISLLAEPTTGAPIAFAYVMDVDEETKQKLDLTYSSERDPLTGLYNRRNVPEKINAALQVKTSLSCLMIMDLDDFKGINDAYGHQAGDSVLKKLSQILTGIFRSSDLAARLGGDEFIVFVDGLPNRECAYERAEEIRRQIYDLNHPHVDGHLSISIGLAFGPDDGTEFPILYEHADAALYAAKSKGKNQIAVYQAGKS